MSGFEVICTDGTSAARRGSLITPHGKVETPVFMPVGTAGAVKGVTPGQLRDTGTEMILANVYHLLLRPGIETVEKLGGVHKLMSWEGPILTDSGGYQIFSLNSLTKVDDGGVEFKSFVDGAKVYLDAAGAVTMQGRLGADVAMCLDQCTPFPCEPAKLKEAVKRTICWAKQTPTAALRQQGVGVFGIVQGGIDRELRQHCASELVKMVSTSSPLIGFDGYAIGGLGLGEGFENMMATVNDTIEVLPPDKPRYLMGVGRPADIIAAVAAGVDMFDCVLPTRNGRNAYAFTEDGPVRLRNNTHTADDRPIEAGCDCYCCRNFSRGSLRHFFNTGEMLGPILASVHNLRFYQRLMSRIRAAIEKKEFSCWAQAQLKKYESL
jgi:queuine tRNA-ribosyltransferase